MRRLGLDPCLGAELAELRDEPLGRPALAVGGRGTLDPLQFLEPLPQPNRFVQAIGTRRQLARLPWADARRWLDHPLPLPRDQGHGRLVVVHRPVPGHPLMTDFFETCWARGGSTPFLLACSAPSASSARSSCTSSATRSSRCATGSGSPASSSGSSAAWRGWTAKPTARDRAEGRARRPGGDGGDRRRPRASVGIAAAGSAGFCEAVAARDHAPTSPA